MMAAASPRQNGAPIAITAFEPWLNGPGSSAVISTFRAARAAAQQFGWICRADGQSGVAPALGVNVGISHFEHDARRLDGSAKVRCVVLGRQDEADRHPQVTRHATIEQELVVAHLFHVTDRLTVERKHLHTDPNLLW